MKVSFNDIIGYESQKSDLAKIIRLLELRSTSKCRLRQRIPKGILIDGPKGTGKTLIAKAFIPNPKHLPQINHLDGNTMNNHVSNLEWCDAYTNMMHAIRTGLRRTGVGSHQTPFAVTDATGKVLRAYPSMKEMVREERLKPAHRNWLILQLKHPDRVKQHALRVQHHRGDAFIMVQTRPNQTTVLNRTTIPNRPTMPNQTTTPPMDAPFSPVLHSVTKQYYRQLSKEEAIAFGVISRAVCKQERRILP